MLDFEYVKANFSDRFSSSDFSATIFSEVVNETCCFGIVENDVINHYTSVHFRTYLRKLKFRVINNMHPDKSISGFSARNKISKGLTARKYLYLLYCLFPPAVFLDSIAMALRKQSVTFFLHFIFVYYVLILIIKYSILKAFGIQSININYGK